MSDDESAVPPPKRLTLDELVERIEKARVAQEQTTRPAPPRGLIVPYSRTMPSTRVDL